MTTANAIVLVKNSIVGLWFYSRLSLILLSEFKKMRANLLSLPRLVDTKPPQL